MNPRSVNHLMPPDKLIPILKEHFKEDWEKLFLLCQEYDIAVDDHMFESLTFALARDFVPAFQEKKKRGPKSKWGTQQGAALVVEI